MFGYLKIILRGIGQVMLQNNALTGLIFLCGIFYNSWLLGLGALLGNITSTLAAVFLKYSQEDIKNGFYGFNGTLVGIAIFLFFGAGPIMVFALMAGAIISSIVMRIMKKNIAAYTAPFVISAWIIILIIKIIGIATPAIAALPTSDSFNLFSTISMGLGQIMLQGNVITGLFFLLALLVNSRRAAFYALYGSCLGGVFALFVSLPVAEINFGLCGYNAALCGIALGDGKQKAFLLVTLAVISSVIINYGLGKIGIITLTAPFVLASWAALLIKNKKLLYASN
ncbi:MAG: urea transporter [Patescibacteria group bacterium]|nr:urea transporter [Patescibacteria group bacterium]MDD4610708.1 urea transporter [Patescibacteria group bacterium]